MYLSNSVLILSRTSFICITRAQLENNKNNLANRTKYKNRKASPKKSKESTKLCFSTHEKKKEIREAQCKYKSDVHNNRAHQNHKRNPSNDTTICQTVTKTIAKLMFPQKYRQTQHQNYPQNYRQTQHQNNAKTNAKVTPKLLLNCCKSHRQTNVKPTPKLSPELSPNSTPKLSQIYRQTQHQNNAKTDNKSRRQTNAKTTPKLSPELLGKPV